MVAIDAASQRLSKGQVFRGQIILHHKEITCCYGVGRNPYILTQSPFHIIAQYFLVGTDILHSILAVKTSLASYHRSYRHRRSDLIPSYPFPYLIDMACHFMAQDGGRMDAPRLFSTEDTHIGSTYRVGSYLDQNFVRFDIGCINLGYFHLARTLKHCCKHLVPPVCHASWIFVYIPAPTAASIAEPRTAAFDTVVKVIGRLLTSA